MKSQNPRFSVEILADFRAILRGQGVFPRRSAFGKSRRALPWLQNKLWQRSVAPLVEELRLRKGDLVRDPFLGFLGDLGGASDPGLVTRLFGRSRAFHRVLMGLCICSESKVSKVFLKG